MSNRKSSKGFLLKRSISSVFTAVGGISKLDFPDADVQFFDGSALDTGVGLQDGEPTGHVAPGSVGGELFVDHADTHHQALFGLLNAPAKESWMIDNANMADFECTFTGTLKKFQPSAAVNDGFKCNFEIKLATLAVYAFS